MTQTVKNIAQNSFFRAIIEAAKLLSGVVLVIILARLLGPSEYGRLSFVLALVTFFSVWVNLGLPLTFVREGAQKEDFLRENLTTGLTLQGIASLILLLVLGISYQLIPAIRGDVFLLLATLIYTTFSVVTNFLYSYFQAVQRMHIEAVAVLIQNILTLVIVLVALALRGTAEIAMFGYAIAAVLSLGFTAILIKKYLFSWLWRVDLKKGKDILAKSWPLMTSLAFGAVYHSLDTIMLRFFKGDIDVGIYSAQYRVIFTFYVFGGWYVFSLLPVLASSFISAREQFKGLLERSVQHMTGFAFLFGLGVTYFAYPIVKALYGQNYLEGVPILQVLIWSTMISLVGTMFYHSLIVAEKQQKAMTSVIGGTITIVVFNILLIPKLGMMGAAISTVIAQIVQLAMNIHASQQVVPIRIFRQFLKPLAYTLSSIVTYYFLSLLASQLIAGSLAWLVYIILTFKGKVLDWKEFRQVFEALIKRA